MVNELRRRPRAVAVALLVVTAMVWGTTFVVVKSAVAHMPVLDFLAWRFLLAGVLLAGLRPRALVRLGWRGVRQGLVLGAVLAAGYMLQTYGLRSTPAAVSGFLTGLQVVFVPLVGWLMLRHRPSARTWGSAAVAVSGLALLSVRGASFGAGETLTVVSAAVFAVQIVLLGRWASVEDAYGLATVQLLTVGAASLVGAAPGGVALPSSLGVWAAVALTAVGATAFAFVVQSWAQSHVSATSTAVVYTTEPLFAAFFAWMAGEQMGWAVLVGGALVIAAMFVLGAGSTGAVALPDPARAGAAAGGRGDAAAGSWGLAVTGSRDDAVPGSAPVWLDEPSATDAGTGPTPVQPAGSLR